MRNSHHRSIKLFPPFPGKRPGLYSRSRSRHTLSGCPWAERRNLVYGFSDELALRQVGTSVPLSPSLGLSQRAETALLNKSVEISTTTGRFCSRCHVNVSGEIRTHKGPGPSRVLRPPHIPFCYRDIFCLLHSFIRRGFILHFLSAGLPAGYKNRLYGNTPYRRPLIKITDTSPDAVRSPLKDRI